MKLTLKKPLAFFDIEATGLNLSKDRIVEIAIVKVFPDGSKKNFHSLVNPEMTIPQEVIDIHGITNDKIKNEPTFRDIAKDLIEFIDDADLAGYNSNKFDIPLLAEELLRVDNNFDLSTKKFVDVQNIFHKMEQRTLAAAYKFYCAKEIENAHSALADTEATLEVLLAQLDKYENDLKTDIDFLADFSKGHSLNVVDFAGRLVKNDKDEVVFNFGVHKGKSLEEVDKIAPGYYGWFIGDTTDFPQYTKLKLKQERERLKQLALDKKNSSSTNEQATKPASVEKEITLEDLAALKNKFKG